MTNTTPGMRRTLQRLLTTSPSSSSLLGVSFVKSSTYLHGIIRPSGYRKNLCRSCFLSINSHSISTSQSSKPRPKVRLADEKSFQDLLTSIKTSRSRLPAQKKPEVIDLHQPQQEQPEPTPTINQNQESKPVETPITQAKTTQESIQQQPQQTPWSWHSDLDQAYHYATLPDTSLPPDHLAIRHQVLELISQISQPNTNNPSIQQIKSILLTAPYSPVPANQNYTLYHHLSTTSKPILQSFTRKQWHQILQSTIHSATPTIVESTSSSQHYQSLKSLPQRIERIFRDMKSVGVSPDSETYAAMYKANSIDPRKAMAIFHFIRSWLKSSGATSTSQHQQLVSDTSIRILLSVLLHGGAGTSNIRRTRGMLIMDGPNGGKLDLATSIEELWDSLKESKCVPTVATIIGFLEAFGSLRERELVEEVHKVLINERGRRNGDGDGKADWYRIDVYDALTKAHYQVGNYKAVCRIVKEFDERYVSELEDSKYTIGYRRDSGIRLTHLRSLKALEAYTEILRTHRVLNEAEHPVVLTDEVWAMVIESLVVLNADDPDADVSSMINSRVHRKVRRILEMDVRRWEEELEEGKHSQERVVWKGWSTGSSPIIYVDIISSYSKLGDLERVMKAFLEMKRLREFEYQHGGGAGQGDNADFTKWVPRRTLSDVILLTPSRISYHWNRICDGLQRKLERDVSNLQMKLGNLEDGNIRNHHVGRNIQHVMELLDDAMMKLDDGLEVDVRVGMMGPFKICYLAFEEGWRDRILRKSKMRERVVGPGGGVGVVFEEGDEWILYDEIVGGFERHEEELVMFELGRRGVKVGKILSRREGGEYAKDERVVGDNGSVVGGGVEGLFDGLKIEDLDADGRDD
ncbi:hypothetical protein HDU76_001947 [Blyttiomyces sp. JEL0837]|nr:hypothetical protein HDU76_001947 [Blyttiomyces sp. JEL0837]